MSIRRNVLRFFISLALVFLSSLGWASSVLKIPLETMEGELTTLADYQNGNPLYVKLWATWCQPCMQQMEHFESTYNEMIGDLQVIGVNVWINDNLPAIEKVIEDKGLSFPVLIDKTGDLAQGLNLLGTPLHVLIDQSGRIVHMGHEADADIDAKISVLAKGKLVTIELDPDGSNLNSLEESWQLQFDNNYDTHAVLFTATWCDWYLEETRPEMSENCSASQHFIKEAAEDYQGIEWQLVASRLWTGEKELGEFQQKHGIKIPSHVDQSNRAFAENNIKNFPTLVLFKEGVEVKRIQKFTDRQNLMAQLGQLFE